MQEQTAISFEVFYADYSRLLFTLVLLLVILGFIALFANLKRKEKLQRYQELSDFEIEPDLEAEMQSINRRNDEYNARIKRAEEATKRPEIQEMVKQAIRESQSVSTTASTNTIHTKITQPQPEPEVIKAKPKPKPENLPIAYQESDTTVSTNLFVLYSTDITDRKENFPIYRIPAKGCIVRSHRYGNTKQRGYKEVSFQNAIETHFGDMFEVSGEVRLNTGKSTRPFEPDIALIEKGFVDNIRIDVEIDEPYAGVTRQPTHCKGDDLMRDAYFVDRGWLVIRFTEYQVHTQEENCLKLIAQILKKINPRYTIPASLIDAETLKVEKAWDIVQAQKWESDKYREKYLKHEFQEIVETEETEKRDFNEQERNEEKLVKQSLIGIIDNGKNVGCNSVNGHPRDNRIKFYSEDHLYTVDNTPIPSVSTVLNKFFPQFDTIKWANKKAVEKLQIQGVELTKEAVQNEAEIIARAWKEKGEKASLEGTFLHNQIENYYLGQDFQRPVEFALFEQFATENKDMQPYRTEWRIFDEDYGIAGTIDLVSKNNTGYEIFDWKRSGKVINTDTGAPITTNPWQKGIGKLAHIPDTSYNRYCLQQGIYRYILESKYGLQVDNMYLVVLHPDNDTYYKVEVPYWKSEVEHILQTISY